MPAIGRASVHRTPIESTTSLWPPRLSPEVILPPGGQFSFNETVGPRDKGTFGFKEAPGAHPVPAGAGHWGVWICQVSSTLYNAVLLDGLPITERHNHSRPPKYSQGPVGSATVVYPGRGLPLRQRYGSAPPSAGQTEDDSLEVSLPWTKAHGGAGFFDGGDS